MTLHVWTEDIRMKAYRPSSLFCPSTININKARMEKWEAVMTRGHNTASSPQRCIEKTRTINLWIIHLTSQATEPLLLSSYLIKPWHFDWPFKFNNLLYAPDSATLADAPSSDNELPSSCDTNLDSGPHEINLCTSRSYRDQIQGITSHDPFRACVGLDEAAEVQSHSSSYSNLHV